MAQITIGRTGLRVEQNGFGALPIQRISKQDAVYLLRKAYDGGMNYYDSARRYSDSEEKLGEAFGDVDLLGKIAERKKATPAQIALAWLLAQKPWIVPIPGTRKLERLDENTGAVAVELASDDLREIESALSKITVQGARYPENLEQMTGR